MADEAQPIAGALWLREDTAATARIVQPFGWRPTVSGALPALACTLYDSAGDAISTAPTVTVGPSLALASGAYGLGQTDPTKLTLTVVAGSTRRDFRRLDRVSVGDPAYYEQGAADDGSVDRWVWNGTDVTGIVYLIRPLIQAYTQTSPVTLYAWSQHHAVAITATHTATAGRHCRLDCTWRHPDGHYETTIIPVHIVQRVPWCSLAPDVLRGRSPEIMEPLASYTAAIGGTATEAVRRAWEFTIARLLSQGMWPDLLRNQALLEDPTEWALRLQMAEKGLVPSSERRDAASYRDECRERLAQCLEGMGQRSDFWYDESDDLAVDETGEVRRTMALYQGW